MKKRWGYINANYANQAGPQMATIKNMITRLTSGGIVDESSTATVTTTVAPTTVPSGVTSSVTNPVVVPVIDNTPCAPGTYRIIKDSITVSGISSGGSMATQLHAAFSKTFSGVGIVTGRRFFFI